MDVFKGEEVKFAPGDGAGGKNTRLSFCVYCYPTHTGSSSISKPLTHEISLDNLYIEVHFLSLYITFFLYQYKNQSTILIF